MYQLTQVPRLLFTVYLFLDLSPHPSTPDTRAPDHYRVLGIDLGTLSVLATRM